MFEIYVCSVNVYCTSERLSSYTNRTLDLEVKSSHLHLSSRIYRSHVTSRPPRQWPRVWRCGGRPPVTALSPHGQSVTLGSVYSSKQNVAGAFVPFSPNQPAVLYPVAAAIRDHIPRVARLIGFIFSDFYRKE